MSKSTAENGFRKIADVIFKRNDSHHNRIISSELVIKAAANSNKYLRSLKPMFEELNFDLYDTLGQRNVSGFISEVFVHSFSALTDDYSGNPHADGRPDLLDLSDCDSKQYFRESCFTTDQNKKNAPVKSRLTPYKYGGVEVKCTIGNQGSKYKKDLGINKWEIGIPRVQYLAQINYWAHHTACENLLGCYYDYYPPAESTPQILAVMHSELENTKDWHPVSIGKANSKKTSNTSLTPSGMDKMRNGVVTIIDDDVYLRSFKRIGLKCQ